MLTRLFGLACCAGLVMLAGCTSTDLTQSQKRLGQTIPVHFSQTSDIYIDRAIAHLQGNQLTVQGNIRRDRLFAGNYHGHVDVILVDTDGQVLKGVLVEYSTSLLIPDGIRQSRFTVVLPVESTIPNQVVVKIHQAKKCALISAIPDKSS